ncbi:MAG: hypothetical protein ACFFDN_08020, partial [Candidatus Hodarchaeota archaeon]
QIINIISTIIAINTMFCTIPSTTVKIIIYHLKTSDQELPPNLFLYLLYAHDKWSKLYYREPVIK